MKVNWKEEDYNPQQPGKQVITGELEIPSYFTNPKELKAEFTVTVGLQQVEGISVTPKTKELLIGETVKLKATTTPVGAEGEVMWLADQEDLVEITSSGKTATITAIEEGTVYIEALVKDNNELRASTKITISAPEPEPEPKPENP